jgi:hypothetical protein
MHGMRSLERNLTARFAARLAAVGVVSGALALGGLTFAARAAQAAPEPMLAAGGLASAQTAPLTSTGAASGPVAAKATLAAPAPPPRHLWVNGQGGGVAVYTDNFTPGAVVRVELLDAGLRTVVGDDYLTTPATGAFDVLMSTSYTGAVWVAADSPGAPTVWAKTYVFAAPHLDSIVGGPTQCGTVALTGSGYYPGATVRVELLDPQLNVIDRQWVTAQAGQPGQPGQIDAGTIRATLVTHGFVGTVFVVSDGGGPAEAWGPASACRT